MGKPIIELFRRNQDQTQTLGNCTVLMDNDLPTFASLSLERGWQNNKPMVSCLPIGIYDVVLEWSPKFNKMLWEIKGVPGRSEAKFHSASFWFNLNGCVALGVRPKHLNSDKYLDLTSSRSTMEDFHKALNGHTKALLIIKGKPGIN